MRYGKCYSSSLLLLLIAALAVSSCKKENGIDNNSVILTPYAVIFGDYLGVLTKTNNGADYKDVILAPDGIPYRAITASGDSGIVFIKNVLRYSTNGGINFNTPGGGLPKVNPAAKWASMMIDVPGDAIYVASINNGNGVEISKDHGVSWTTEPISPRWSGITGAGVASFARTSDGYLYGLNPNGANLFQLPTPTSTASWNQVTIASGLPAGTWYLASYNTALVAADYTGAAGIFHSDDKGVSWTAYSGIPGNQEILSCAAPLGAVLLAGTDSAGVYRLDGGVFKPSNNGLEAFTSVYGITGKQDTYKNGLIKRYVYIATNKGLYRSEDLGQNWVLVKAGTTSFRGDLRAIW